MALIFISILCSPIFYSLSTSKSDTVHYLTGLDDGLEYEISVDEDLVNDITYFRINDIEERILGVRGIESISTQLNRFLEVQFIVRGGSGVKIRRKVIFCISKKKIHKCLDVISSSSSILKEVYDKVADSLRLFDEKEDYELAITLVQRNDTYQALLTETKTIESKFDSSQNESFSNRVKLEFDKAGCFFYNSIKKINEVYNIYSATSNQTRKELIKGELPSIELYQGYYILIQNDWCVNNRGDTFSCQ